MTEQQEDGYCLVMTTCASRTEATRLATALVEARAAACVQVLETTSFYPWKGELAAAAERLLLIKTRLALYPTVEATLRRLHSYQTPEILCVPIAAGFAGYLAWVDAVTGAG